MQIWLEFRGLSMLVKVTVQPFWKEGKKKRTRKQDNYRKLRQVNSMHLNSL